MRVTRTIVRPTIVYVSGPITTGGNVPLNVRNGILAGMTIRKRGYAVFCPHERIVTEMLDPHTYEWWMERDFVEIEACDVVYRMAGDDGRTLPSNGGDREVEYAGKIGRTVYWSLETLFTVPIAQKIEVVEYNKKVTPQYATLEGRPGGQPLSGGFRRCFTCGNPIEPGKLAEHDRCRGAA